VAPAPATSASASPAPESPAQKAEAEAAPAAAPANPVDAPEHAAPEAAAEAPALFKPAELAAALADAPSQEAQLLPALAALWQAPAGDAASCDALARAGLHCFHGAGGLAELRQLGRPAILTLADDSGAQRHALLLALDASGAELRFGERTLRVGLAALERRLPGRYLSLWRASPDFRSLLKPGDSGPDVDWVAARLAALNGEAAPPVGHPYGAALAKAVRVFQSAQGLQSDGVVGPKTIMLLNSASHEAEPRLRGPAPLRKNAKE
jgi:general secretion pathway protein A